MASRRETGEGDDPKSIVGSVLRACRVLELLGKEGRALSLAPIADATELSRPTAHRLLSTLVRAGWVRRTQTGQYALTMRAFMVGASAQRDATLRDLAHGVLMALAESSGDTTYLMIPNDGKALCAERIEGPHPVRVHQVNVGNEISLLSGAAPLAMVAFQPDLLVDPEDRKAAATADVAARLEAAVRDGFVVSPDDVLPGVTAVGAPVFDSHGSVVAGVSVTGTNDRYAGEHLGRITGLVSAAAADISAELGFLGRQ